MLYEIVGIARAVGKETATKETIEVLKTIGKQIIDNRGVVRDIKSWGIRPLPKIMKKHGDSYLYGSFFYLKFDASPGVQSEISRILRVDRRMIRSTVVKLGGESLKNTM
ncbi:mitochondrial 37S ribosomal protein bS6m [Magnusiomyces paraingens]|uniref:Ribosomal protein S6 n=1 Tax=Magnusiomyces paraingens TaxID=2606893 RepID=A0A5E8BG54_9ASCO|nr:uncharacterized protein SAPINGB_P002794 [Saprochaete ingens]VVT50530.1 unnamed protein product [Saprochaete ingens]